MAAVSIPPSPHAIGSMASRRVPLSNVPNAANSPFRAVAVAASKRVRSQPNATEDIPYDEPPPAKKQIIEVERSVPRTPPPRKQPTEGRVFNRRPIDTQLTAFDRKLLAVKDRTVHGRGVKIERNGDEPLDTLRQWQKHYRKVFPSFVFYFESVPEDARRQCSRHLHAFGAVSRLLICPKDLLIILIRGRRSSSHEMSHTLLRHGRPLSRAVLAPRLRLEHSHH